MLYTVNQGCGHKRQYTQFKIHSFDADVLLARFCSLLVVVKPDNAEIWSPSYQDY